MVADKTIALKKRTLMKIPDAEARILLRLDDLLTAMLDLALGHFVYIPRFNKETGEVETRVYEREPDAKAAMFLIENVIGKTPQRIEMTGKDGGPVKVIPWMSMDEAVKIGLLPSLTATDDANEDEDETDSHQDDVLDGEFHVAE